MSVVEPEETFQQVHVISHTDEIVIDGGLVPVRHAYCAEYWVASLQLSVVNAVHLVVDRLFVAKWSVEPVGYETSNVRRLDS